MKDSNAKRKQKLAEKSYIAIRAYLKFCGWNDFDPQMLTNNMGFVIDPITEQNFPIDHAFTIQTQRELFALLKKNERI